MVPLYSLAKQSTLMLCSIWKKKTAEMTWKTVENLEEEEEKHKTKEQITPFSREVNNYLTSKASTVKMDMDNTKLCSMAFCVELFK